MCNSKCHKNLSCDK